MTIFKALCVWRELLKPVDRHVRKRTIRIQTASRVGIVAKGLSIVTFLSIGSLSLPSNVAGGIPRAAASVRTAAVGKLACPYMATEFSNALGYDFEPLDTGSTETAGVSSTNCSFASNDMEFVVSVSVSRWASKARFTREWKTSAAAYGAIVGAPLVPVAGAKDNAKVTAKEQGKVQVALTYTSGTSLVAVTLSSSPSAAKAFAFKPEIVKLRRKKI
jgi:hypothetical protein